MVQTEQQTPTGLSRTPTNASTSSFSLISDTTSALDRLSISTGSLDSMMRDISTRGYHSRNESSSSASAQSQTGSAQHQVPDIQSLGSVGDDEDDEDDYEVILVPRSLASSIIGMNISTRSISGFESLMGGEWKEEVEEGKTPSQPPHPLPSTNNEPVSSASSVGAGPTSSRDTAITAEQARWEAKKARNKAKNKAKAAQRKADAAARAAMEVEQESGTVSNGSVDGSGSYTGLSSDDVVKIEKGKGKAKGKKTRRAGEAAGKRIQNKEMGVVGTPSGSTYPISGTSRSVHPSALELLTGGKAVSVPPPSNTASLQKLHLLDLLNNGGGSVSSRSTTEDDDDDDDETESGDMDEVDQLSELGSGVPEVYMDVKGETPSRRRRRGGIKSEGSILSAEDARSSIDEFLMDPSHSMTREEKLRFWQSLCFELGLADLDDSPPSLPDLPSSPPIPKRSESPSTSRSITPTQARPMPQTLFDARYLLKTEGHVNIADYFDARKSDGIKQEEGQEMQAGKYAYLVQPSVSSMKKYTKSNGRFVNLSVVKAEAMQPLLRNFGFKLGRERREARGGGEGY